MASRRFDLLHIEQYDFDARAWSGRCIMGQLKRGDQFLSIYHRPTRKRMLFTDPCNAPEHPVIRVQATGEVFMVGALQMDAHADTHYRNVYSLTLPNGPAQIIRRTPKGPANDPGWAISEVIQDTWADVELNSLSRDEEQSLYHHGHMMITTPRNSPLQPLDTIQIGGPLGQEYYVLERYIDSSLVNARAVARRDERIDIVFREFLGETYDVTTGRNLLSFRDRNITARVSPVSEEELREPIIKDAIKIMVSTSFIGIRPKIGDRVLFQGYEYRVDRMDHDPLEDEYHMWANLAGSV